MNNNKFNSVKNNCNISMTHCINFIRTKNKEKE